MPDDLTTRAAEIVKQSRRCGRICLDAEDHCPCREIAAAVVALVLDEAAKVAETHFVDAGVYSRREHGAGLIIAAAIRALGGKT